MKEKELIQINLSSLYDDDSKMQICGGITRILAFENQNSVLSNVEIKVNYEPQPNDKIFFMPGVSVPRIKLKDLATNLGIKTTRNITDANAVFMSNNTIHKMVNIKYLYYCNTEDFKFFLDTVKDYFDSDFFNQLTNELTEYEQDIICFDSYGSARVLQNEDLPANLGDVVKNIRFLHFKEDYTELGALLLQGGLCEFFDESEILNHVNNKGVVINEEVYINLSNMFDSSDQDNTILAMEIMANSNYTDSLLYLELLFMNYSYAINNSGKKNHVNFKGLCSYLGKDVAYLGTDIDDIMKSLESKNRMTKENVTLLLRQASDQLHLSGSTRYFTIKSLSLNDDVLKNMNANFSYELQTDITPEVVEEVVEEVKEEVAVDEEVPVVEEMKEEDLITHLEESPCSEEIIITTNNTIHYDL